MQCTSATLQVIAVFLFLSFIREFKEYLTREGRSDLLLNDARWKHRVDVVELGKNSDVVEQFLLSLKPQRITDKSCATSRVTDEQVANV